MFIAQVRWDGSLEFMAQKFDARQPQQKIAGAPGRRADHERRMQLHKAQCQTGKLRAIVLLVSVRRGIVGVAL